MARWSLLGIAWLVRAVTLFALWLLLVDGTDVPNMVVGGVCAVAAAALATVAQSLRSVRTRPRASMFRHAFRPLILLVTDTVRVTWALLQRLILRRQVRGAFRAVHYGATGDDAEEVARRLLTQWAASMGPNRYAIGVDPTAQVLIVHQLVDAGGPLDPLELG